MKKILLLILMMTMLAACTDFAGPSAPQKKYLFNIHYPKVTKKYITADTLEVESAVALPQFARREFIYRVSSIKYLTDYYHIFMVPPTEQVKNLTARYLEGRGIFKQISTNKMLMDEADYTLRSRIIALYADYTNSSRPLAVVKIRYVLIDNIEKRHPVLLNEVFSAQVPLKAKTSSALVNAWDQGLQRIVRQLGQKVYAMLSD